MRGEESAKTPLMDMLAGGKESPYWRAVAANLLWHWTGEPEVKAALLARLKDEHPLVREKTIRALESLVEAGDSETIAALKPTLDDPVRCVRVAAAWALRATVDLQSRAGRELEHALSLDADQPSGQYRLAMFQLARQQPAEALAHLQKAIAWDPLSPPFRCMSAMVLNRMGRTAEALEALAQAEKLSPNDPQIPYARATVLVRTGRLEEAQAAAKQALELQRDFQPARELLEQLRTAPR